MRLLLSLWMLLITPSVYGQKAVSKEIEDTHEREISVDIRVKLSKPISESRWKSCFPQRDSHFPEAWTAKLEEKIFGDKELGDLKECKVTSCAFRYRPDERAELHNIKTEVELKKKVLEFYKNRASGRVLPYAHEEEFRIQKSNEAFDFCKSEDVDQLLKTRDHPKAITLIKVDQGEKRMRPTTRLVRGLAYPSGKSWCWAEALVFSNHYDLDRVELWEASNAELRLVVRERLDFLHSWWRRMRKGEIQNVLEKWAIDEVNELFACVTKNSPPQ